MKVGITIVHFGEQWVLDDCLVSLPKNDPMFDVKIFDCNKTNLGFTKGTNELVREFFSDRIDWIWLLNNDTTVPSETLQHFSSLDILSKNVGIIGFQIRSMDEPDLIHHAGTLQCYPNGIHKSGSVKLKQHNEKTFEKWVTFASVLIRREVFEQIGLLDQNMRHICSDSDFCYRARNAGWKIMYDPKFVVYHKIGTSQNPNSEIMRTMHQDTLYFQNKWISGKLFLDLDRELI